MPRPFISCFWPYFVLATGWTAASACRKDDRTNAINVEPLRSGSQIDPTDPMYYDALPSLSDDGRAVALISGRLSQPKVSALRKAYKAAWPERAAPEGLVRLTDTEDEVLEQSALLSPDGRLVAIQMLIKGRNDLYLQDFASKDKRIQVTDDEAVERGVSFSPDGKLLAWVKADAAAGTTQAIVVEIGDGTVEALRRHVVIAAGGDFVRQALWVPVSGTGYQLAVASPSPGGDAVDYSLVTFDSAAAAATAAGTPWLSKFQSKLEVAPAFANGKALLVRKLAVAEGVVQNQIGSGVAQPPATALVAAEPAYASLTSTEAPKTYPQKSSFDVVAVALSADGKTAFMLNRHFYLCAGDPAASFGAAFSVSEAGIGTSPSPFSPRLTATNRMAAGSDYKLAFNLAGAGFCDRNNADGSTSRVDDQMLSMAVARSATSSTYRIGYTTRVAPHFDQNCQLKAGDQEVWLIDADGSSHTFYPLSDNQQALKDADRGRDGRCTF